MTGARLAVAVKPTPDACGTTPAFVSDTPASAGRVEVISRSKSDGPAIVPDRLTVPNSGSVAEPASVRLVFVSV